MTISNKMTVKCPYCGQEMISGKLENTFIEPFLGLFKPDDSNKKAIELNIYPGELLPANICCLCKTIVIIPNKESQGISIENYYR